MKKEFIHILPAAQEGAYWIGIKFVFASNWEISKHRFTEQEQIKFETDILKIR